MTSRLLSLRAAVLVASTCAGGCDRGPQLAEVEGVITCGGRPLAKVEVVFLPDQERGTLGPRSGGYTDDAGRYRLTAPGGGAGAAVGTHRVTVRDLTAIRGSSGATGAPVGAGSVPKVRFAANYQSPSTTPLTAVTVQPGGNVINFDLPGPDK